MTLSIPPIASLPQPPLKTDPANFAERADTFLDALPDFVTETNTAIGEMNKITSGLDQQSPIAAFSPSTTYNFPDVVAGSDGYSYRCVGTGVVGVEPTTDDGTYWVKLATPLASEAEALAGAEDEKALSPATSLAMIRSMAMPEPPSGVDVTGGIFGMDLSKTGANQVTVSKGTCLDSTLTVALTLVTDTAVAIPAVANTIYHVFVVRLIADGSMTVKVYTSEAGVTSDSTVDQWRWVGFCRTEGSGVVINFFQIDDVVEFTGYTSMKFGRATSPTFVYFDLSSFVPISRIKAFRFCATNGQNNASSMFFSVDGSIEHGKVGSASVGSITPGDLLSFVTNPGQGNTYFATRVGDYDLDMHIHAVKLRR